MATDAQRAARLIARLRIDHVQARLMEGLDSSLSAYLLEQWEDRRTLTVHQMDRLEAMLRRYEQSPASSHKKGAA